MRILLAITMAMAFAMPIGAKAAVVAIGSTLVGDAGGIDAQGAAVSVSSYNPAYFSGPTTPASEWVWVGNINTNDTAIFEFNFNLAGFNINTASLSGLWGIDNIGTVYLNGNNIASLPSAIASNYTQLHAYGTSAAAFFNAGANTLTFDLQDTGGPAAFRATVLVEAETLAAVPLPAGAPLLLGGIALFGAVRMRRRR